MTASGLRFSARLWIASRIWDNDTWHNFIKRLWYSAAAPEPWDWADWQSCSSRTLALADEHRLPPVDSEVHCAELTALLGEAKARWKASTSFAY